MVVVVVVVEVEAYFLYSMVVIYLGAQGTFKLNPNALCLVLCSVAAAQRRANPSCTSAHARYYEELVLTHPDDDLPPQLRVADRHSSPHERHAHARVGVVRHPDPSHSPCHGVLCLRETRAFTRRGGGTGHLQATPKCPFGLGVRVNPNPNPNRAYFCAAFLMVVVVVNVV